ncbi:hypothetical protein [Caenimonas sedimenti]|uniref:hypothetical protein n=1 Tax=Caenimonas sedimenti TaxID=2596921 RepID=UPI001647D488|nr:hypothetical protein [Caenimonas sedimenti]
MAAAAIAAASIPLGAQPAPADAPGYQSAFDGYRPFEAGEVQDWRKSNDTVREIGGWRAYAREIHGAQPAPTAGQSPSGAAPSPSKPGNPHQGHQR